MESMCNAPCDQVIDARAGSFVLTGIDIPPSSPFQLSLFSGDLTLHVKAGNSGRRMLGIVGISLGLVAACVAVVGFGVAASLSPVRQQRGEAEPLFMTGIIGAGATVVLGGGGLLLVSGSGTEYTLDTKPARRVTTETVVSR
jgi:hypothetical protein